LEKVYRVKSLILRLLGYKITKYCIKKLHYYFDVFSNQRKSRFCDAAK